MEDGTTVMKILIPIVLLAGMLALSGEPYSAMERERCVTSNVVRGYVRVADGRVVVHYQINDVAVLVDRPLTDMDVTAEQILIHDMAREIAHELTRAL